MTEEVHTIKKRQTQINPTLFPPEPYHSLQIIQIPQIWTEMPKSHLPCQSPCWKLLPQMTDQQWVRTCSLPKKALPDPCPQEQRPPITNLTRINTSQYNATSLRYDTLRGPLFPHQGNTEEAAIPLCHCETNPRTQFCNHLLRVPSSESELALR